MSCSEDGYVNIWDTRTITADELKSYTKRFEWTPIVSINLFRMD